VLFTLSQLPEGAGSAVGPADWRMMAAGLPPDRSDADVTDLFYPGRSPSAVGELAPRRRVGLLLGLDDQRYHEVYQRVLGTRSLRFPDVQRFTRLSRDDGRILYTVMGHVVSWLNATPTTIINKADNNKPLLRNDLLPALRDCTSQLVRSAEKRLGAFTWDINHRSTAEAASILLQQEVLESTLDQLQSIKSVNLKQYLDQPFENDGGRSSSGRYAERFLHVPWAGILQIVRRYVGEDFRTEWTTSSSMSREPADESEVRPGLSTDLATQFCNFIQRNTDVCENATFSSQMNSESFRVALHQWFNDHCLPKARDTSEAKRKSPTKEQGGVGDPTRHPGQIETVAVALAVEKDQDENHRKRGPLEVATNTPARWSKARAGMVSHDTKSQVRHALPSAPPRRDWADKATDSPPTSARPPIQAGGRRGREMTVASGTLERPSAPGSQSSKRPPYWKLGAKAK
jgi:hypothetical protein